MCVCVVYIYICIYMCIYIYINESLCYTAEINTTLLINSDKNKFKKIQKCREYQSVDCWLPAFYNQTFLNNPNRGLTSFSCNLLLVVLKPFLFIYFAMPYGPCEILVPQWGTEPMQPAVEALEILSFNHWIYRQVSFKLSLLIYCIIHKGEKYCFLV